MLVHICTSPINGLNGYFFADPRLPLPLLPDTLESWKGITFESMAAKRIVSAVCSPGDARVVRGAGSSISSKRLVE